MQPTLLRESAWCLCGFRVQQHSGSEGRNWTQSDTFLWSRRPAEKKEKKKVGWLDWLLSTEAGKSEANQILGFVFEATVLHD